MARKMDICFIDCVNELDSQQLENVIKRILAQLRVPVSRKGYKYIYRAIELVASGQNDLYMITKVLYKRIADEYGTTSLCVERNIRHLIEVTWRDLRNADYILYFFGYTLTCERSRPTNMEFIATITDNIKMGYHIDIISDKDDL